MKSLALASVALCVLVLTTGCQSMTGKTVGQSVDDTKIQAEVKTKLAADRISNLTRVNVDTVRGVVYLTGIVPTVEDKVQALRTAGSVSGVRGVVDNLVVETASTAPAPTTASAASPATADAAGRQTIVGDVTKVDHDSGEISVRTSTGTVELRLPPASVRNLRNGDRVRLDVALEPVSR